MTVLAEHWRPRLRSTQLNLLVLIVPMILIITAGFAYYVNAMNARQLEAKLRSNIERVSLEQAIILADLVVRKEFESVHLLLATVVADPAISGVKFATTDNKTIISVGQPADAVDNSPRSMRHITALQGGTILQLATLTVTASRKPMEKTLARQHMQLHLLALLLFIATICTTWLAYRFVAGGPLELLVHSIRNSNRKSDDPVVAFEPIPFDGRDEIAQLIHAYNQSERERIENLNQVVETNHNLEATVEQRTAELQSALEAVEKASREKSYFFASMSHELRTPLNSIIGFADIIRAANSKSAAGKDVCEHAKVIADSGRHLLSLVNTILDYAKARSGKMELNETEVDLCEVIEVVEQTFRPIAANKSITIETRYQCAPILVTSDMRKLMQIAMNVISNALKFAPSASMLYISVGRSDDDGGWFEVRDTGPGMTALELELAVEPFRQVAGPATGDDIGTGLGLPLSIELAKMHGGELILQSTPGKGTSAKLVLPYERRICRAGRASRGLAA